MYKDRIPQPHQLSYSAVTNYQSSTLNLAPYQRYQIRQPMEQFNNNHYRSSNKTQGNSDLAFLRNTVGPISTLNTQNSLLKPNDSRKIDASLRQTMNVTSDVKDRLRLSSALSAKRSSRAQTVNESQLPSKRDTKQPKQEDRLEKIMSKFDKKNETKQALKLLEQLKQLKKKQQELKKQRKNEPGKDEQNVSKTSVSNNTTLNVNNASNSINSGYEFGSPVNFSKKNKVDYYTPTSEKKQHSAKGSSPQNNDGIFIAPRVKKNSYDLTNKQQNNNLTNNININVNGNSYKPSSSISETSSLLYPSSRASKSPSNYKAYYENSSPSTSSALSYSFSKGASNSNNTKYDYDRQKDYSQYSSKRYYDPTVESNSPLYQSVSTNNVLNVTTKDNSLTNNVSKSPNSKISISKSSKNNYTSDYLSNSVNYTSGSTYSSSKSYEKFDSNTYEKSDKNTFSSKNYGLSIPGTNQKDVFANRKVSISDFILGKNLGQGKFGTVFQAFDKKSKTIYALKKVPKSIIKSHWMVDQFMLEVKIQNFLNHPNILSLHGCFDDSQNVYILLEYMQEGTLFLHLKKNTTLCQKQAAVKLKQIGSAIQYLHENGIAHRDLKPQNIVMSHGVCKLCDFGWATICDERRKTYCGTFDYAAPEILQGTEYDMSVDLWCLGVLAYEILVGKAPFYHISRKQTMKKIMNCQNQKIAYPASMSYEAKSFIQHLLKKNPQQRLKSQDLLKHPFFGLADK